MLVAMARPGGRAVPVVALDRIADPVVCTARRYILRLQAAYAM